MNVLSLIGTLIDLLTAIVAFGLIIVVHELGHFLAARWAGVRVLAFAVGFGPALFSWRKGFGLRRGSSEQEYHRRLRQHIAQHTPPASELPGVSPTEYRFNALPFGGYVKMLGQDDTDPTAVSDEPDSWQRCRAWKRLIVISAGVVANVICAALLYVVVFQAGLVTEPPVVGMAAPGSPAAKTVATNADRLGVEAPGLQPWDRVVQAGGRRARSFQDIVLASAMASPNRPTTFVVERHGIEEPLIFEVMPEKSPVTGLLEVGVEPARSAVLLEARNKADRDAFRDALERFGLPGLEPGMRLVRVGDDTQIDSAFELMQRARTSGGHSFDAEFQAEDGSTTVVEIQPVPAIEAHVVPGDPKRPMVLDHLLGLAPVMQVLQVQEGGARAGLKKGDVFARVGSVEYPSLVQGIAEIRSHKPGSVVPLVVLRGEGPLLDRQAVTLEGRVSKKGTIGFHATDTGERSTIVSLPPARLLPVRAGEEPFEPAAARFISRPGIVIESVDGQPVSDFNGLNLALRYATRGALEAGTGATVTLVARLPLPPSASGERPTQRIAADLTADEVAHLHGLGWRSPLPLNLFQPEQFRLKASSPLEAVAMGLDETQRVMLMTYVTFVRLFEGTVRVEHLKGPVGIAHIGTRIADRGLLWLMFFAALISINLAVINFLPLPIVDGGQAVFILVEMVRGRPVPMAIQSATAMIGLVLVAIVFLVITFNDVMNLLG